MIDANSQFFAILTNVGMSKQANADALGIPWKITDMGVGDANPNGLENPPNPIPSPAQTKLLNEWRRRPLNQLKIDPVNPAVVIAEQVIPADEGGRWIREIGLYDVDGDLVAVANCAPSFKPMLSQGSGRTQVVRLNFQVTSTGNITLKIDPSVVLATRSYVDNTFNSIIEVFAQKTAYDGTPGKLMRVGGFGWGSSYENGPFLFSNMTGDQTIFSGLYRYSPETVGHPEFGSGYGSVLQSSLSNSGGNWATQLVIDYAADAIGFRRLSGPAGWQQFQEIWHRGNLKAATQEQTNSGVDDTTYLTPKKFAAGLAALVIQATEEIRGLAKVATQSDLRDGADDTRFVTAKKLTTWFATKTASYAAAGIAAFANASELRDGNSETKMLSPGVIKYGFSMLKAPNGYIVFPPWLGGLIIQWGTAEIPAGRTNVPYTLTYPNASIVTVGQPQNITGGLDGVEIQPGTSSYFPAVIVSVNGSAAQAAGVFAWLSIGW